MAGNPEAQSVLDYWYNPEKDMGYLMKNVWFGGGEKQDNELREKFGSLVRIISRIFGDSKFCDLKFCDSSDRL